MSMRGRMLCSFLLFGAVVIAVLWLFQTFWLDDIYRALKLDELKNSAEAVSEAAYSMIVSDVENTKTASDETTDDASENDASDSGESEPEPSETDAMDGFTAIPQYDYSALDSAAGENAGKYDICITVYEITDTFGGRGGRVVVEKHVNTFCFIHNIGSQKLLNALYKGAVQNNGTWIETVSLETLFDKQYGGAVHDDGENVILARLVAYGDRELLCLFNSELIPLRSTVSTLRMQLLIVSAVLVVLAVVLAFFLSKRIADPIRKMSSEASKLALGDYNVNFDGGNCAETENLSEILNRAAYELSRLDKMQKDLVANVSHDLRTPLTMISGYAEAIRDLPGEATPENIQIVIDEAKRLTGLVNDMLEVSKYQNGTQTLHRERFNLTETVRTTIERYSKLMEHDGYAITFESDGDAYVDADESRILQVIYNLVGNAVNYTGEDKSVKIRQTVDRDSDEVLIEVIDTGAGIPEDQLPLVWERYYKVHDFHKRANVGTGLGLSIVKNILLLHGAKFGVKSKVGEGSCFWFKLNTVE